MQSTDHLLSLLRTVGLLRGRFSLIMQGINDLRKPYRERHEVPPRELSVLMGKAQEHFAELLKASDILYTVRENLKASRPGEEAFDTCIEDWALSQAGGKLKPVIGFFEELAEFSIDDMEFDPSIYQGGLRLIRSAQEKQELI